MDEGFKPCPHCAEPIREAAKICRFCNRPVDSSSQPTVPPTVAPTVQRPAPKASGLNRALVALVVVSLFLALAVYVLQNLRMSRARADQARQDFRAMATPSPTVNPTVDAVPTVSTPTPEVPTPQIQALARGNYSVQPGGYITFPFSIPEGATRVSVKGAFHAFGGSGNDIQAVIANSVEFENWINGHQAQVLYGTQRTTNGEIEVADIPPGDYVLAFSNKFSGMSRKQVTADIVLAYWP
jgi:hypothetical protein